MHTHSFLLALAVSTVSVFAQDLYEARVFDSADGQLPYRILKPPGFDSSKKYPLVVLLHGAGERGNDNKSQLKWGGALFSDAKNQEKYPAFVLVPQCPKDRKWVEIDWAAVSPVAPADAGATQWMLLAVIDTVQKEFPIDTDRLYLTGLSMGGYGTWDMVTRYPERWAAAAPICGGGDKSKGAAAKGVPIWAFHGTADAVVKPERSKEMVSAVAAAGGSVVHTEYVGIGHDSWSSAFSEPNFLAWMFAQKRGTPAKMELAASALTSLAMPPADVFPGAGPLQVGDWFKKLWLQKRVEFSKNKEAEKGAIVFLGDSITQGWSGAQKDFPTRKIANRGISGDTSRGVRYRLKEDVLDLNPKAVSILIGTNDLALGATAEQIIDNVKAIIAELQKQNPNVPIILNRVMPRGGENNFPVKIGQLNAMFDALAAADKRLTICDSFGIFNDGSGKCKKEEFPDMLHPNGAGYAKWKSALEETLSKLKL
jgi:poly(3-hydroxybutyrate) depolymerase/lysophospholipase L1-like esterase